MTVNRVLSLYLDQWSNLPQFSRSEKSFGAQNKLKTLTSPNQISQTELAMRGFQATTSVLKLILITSHLNLVFPVDSSAKHFPGGQMMEKCSGGGQVRARVKLWYLLSNCPVSICDVCVFLFFCEPGANHKLLLCPISEPQLNCRSIKCHVRCVLFMFLVYVLTLISFFLCPGMGWR